LILLKNDEVIDFLTRPPTKYSLYTKYWILFLINFIKVIPSAGAILLHEYH